MQPAIEYAPGGGRLRCRRRSQLKATTGRHHVFAEYAQLTVLRRVEPRSRGRLRDQFTLGTSAAWRFDFDPLADTCIRPLFCVPAKSQNGHDTARRVPRDLDTNYRPGFPGGLSGCRKVRVIARCLLARSFAD